MKCDSCYASMVLERTESSAVSRSDWYHCPLCQKVRMTTWRKTVNPAQLSKLDSIHAYEPDAEFDYPELAAWSEQPEEVTLV